jgi:Holliday junction resolvase RusA-like endonuclease
LQMRNSYVFEINPMGKPRMTQRDKWAKRPAVTKYWQFKDKLKEQAVKLGFEMPEANYHMTFQIPMPESWSKKKKEQMNGKPHQQKPDKDNIEKAFTDALCKDDSYIWDGRTTKIWGYTGKIEVVITEV